VPFHIIAIQLVVEGSVDGITHCNVLNCELRYLATTSFEIYKNLYQAVEEAISFSGIKT
jgi:hypothetical protein